MVKYWYAVRTKPRKERFAAGQLKAREVEVFFPTIKVNPVNPRAARIRPYFPGYLFVQVDLEAIGKNRLNWVPGVHGLVSFGGEPATVPEPLIQTLREKLANLKAEEVNRHRFQSGDRVRVVHGPFAGYEAIFDTSLSGDGRVQVLISFLSRYPQPVKLDVEQLVKRKKD